LENAEHCVLCFFQDVIDDLNVNGSLRQKYTLGSERGPNPLYEMHIDGRPLGVFHPGVGAPLAAAFLEELIALGYRKFVACGGCGVLDKRITLGHIIVPTTAVRDEGTSYHYLPPSREVNAAPEAVEAITETLNRGQIDYLLAKNWTTDAIYRETPDRVARRRAEGCLTVEMEMAAFCAVAQFWGVLFGQILYGGDDLSGENWDHRGWQGLRSIRTKLFSLAAEACMRL